MTTYIAILSSDLDGESIREQQVEADSKELALSQLEAICTGPEWIGYSLSNIRPKRGGARPGAGRPKGKARAGTYGDGVATKPVRVPLEVADKIPELLQNISQLQELLTDWEQEANNSTSPRYDRARKLLSEIRSLGF